MLRPLLAAVALVLLLPGSALAETLTVDPADADNACTRGSDNTCKTVAQAVDQAQGGDTISVLAGTYAESVTIDSGLAGLKLTGNGAKLTGSGTGDVLTIQATSVEVSGFAIEVTAGGGSAVNVTGGAVLASVSASRTHASSVNDPVIDVAGTAQLTSCLVLQQIGAVGTPAIASSGTGGTRLLDTTAANFVGPVVTFSNSDANTIVRSTLLSAEATDDRSDAVQVLSGAPGARKLVVDSSILVGGAKAAGVLVQSTGDDAGASTLDLRHATVAGAAKGLELDAGDAQGPGAIPGPAAPAGSISARALSSIVHPASTATAYEAPDGGLLTSSNDVALTFSDSDAPEGTADGGATITMGNATTTSDAQLFAKGFTLRQDATAAIDKGGALEAGESTTDVNGDPRTSGAATDKGADEFVNKAPTAAIEVAATTVKEDQPLAFAAKGTDPEQASGAGGGIAGFVWDFGDGSARETTTTPTHRFARAGSFTVTMVAVDTLGAVSIPVKQTIIVTDGVAPVARITAPANRAKLILNPKKTKRRRLTVLGRATDPSGIAKVEVALYATQRAEKKQRLKKGQCLFYSGRLWVKKACSKEIWLRITVAGEAWTLRTRKGTRVPPGTYAVRVRATDGAGNLSSAFTVKDRSLVRFTVK